MKLLVVPAAVFCLTICVILSASAEDEAPQSSPVIEDEFVAKPRGGKAGRTPRIRESEATGRTDVLVLKNGNRFEGLILDETTAQITFARYSSRVASPHALRVSKSDIAGIERVRPERRAALEAEVRELLDNTRVARQQAEIKRRHEAEMARQQQLAEAAIAFQQTIEAAQRQSASMRTRNGPSRSRNQYSPTRAAGKPWSGGPSRTARLTRAARPALTARRVASVSTPGVRAAGKG